MHPVTEESRLVASTAILKVLSRWAPHARHDVVGACSPISLDLSLLNVKSKRAPLTPDDVATFIERGKANIKNTIDEINRVILLQKQDRQVPIAVADLMEKMARSTRTLFATVDWSAPADANALGSDSEYDLTIAVWAALMALFDRHGPGTRLRLDARRDDGGLHLGFYVTEAAESMVAEPEPGAPHQRISFEEVRDLADYLGFAFAETGGGIEFARAAAPQPSTGGEQACR